MLNMKRFLFELKRIFIIAINYVCIGYTTLKKQNMHYILTLLICLALIAYQQSLIVDLQEQIVKMNDSSNSDSLAHRIWNIEYIQDSHTSDIYKTKIKVGNIEDKIRNINSSENELKWRIMQLEWNK